jgi:hypothetical protein
MLNETECWEVENKHEMNIETNIALVRLDLSVGMAHIVETMMGNSV